MSDSTSPAPRRHSIRERGKFTKATPARPAPSPHDGAVQSAYDAAQISKTPAFTPHRVPGSGAPFKGAVEVNDSPQGGGKPIAGLLPD